MGAISSAVKHMLAAGMDADAIVRAIEDMEAATEVKATAEDLRRERNRRYYERKASEKRLKASEQDVSDADRLKSSEGRLNQDASRADSITSNPSEVIPPSPPKGGSSPKPKRRQVAEDFWPSPALTAWFDGECDRVGFRGDRCAMIANETPTFIDRNRSRGETYTSPDLAWRNWMRKALKWSAAPNAKARASPRPPSQDEIWMNAVAKVGGTNGNRDHREPEIISPGYDPSGGRSRGALFERDRGDTGRVEPLRLVGSGRPYG